MAARTELGHGDGFRLGAAADASGRLIIQLEDEVGTEPIGLVGIEGPVLNLELQRPGPGREGAVICGGQDVDLWGPVVQPFLEFLNCSWRGNFLQLSTWF